MNNNNNGQSELIYFKLKNDLLSSNVQQVIAKKEIYRQITRDPDDVLRAAYALLHKCKVLANEANKSENESSSAS